MKNILNKTKEALINYPALRDDKIESLVLILQENEGLSIEDSWIVARHYTKAATIDRAWRKAQQDNPKLRGKTWVERQGKQENVKKELGYKIQTI